MSVSIGTPFTDTAKKVLLCGSGELGKEVVIELQRYGVEVIALDAYADAPAMQVADRAHIVSMLDAEELRKIIKLEIIIDGSVVVFHHSGGIMRVKIEISDGV